jgi:glycosyltransferase involved in cell wall biosynthesis
MRAALAFTGRTVAVSRELAGKLSDDLGVARSRIAVIPNGVRPRPRSRAPIRQELHIGPADRLIVAVGNLYPVKGHRHLIDAVGLLASRYPTLHLAICGRGELAEALTAQALDLGVADRVHLLGLRPDVAGILEVADVFVHPSLSEALPLAVLEAMFAARPIVATNVGEIASALDHGEAGLLVERGSPSALASAIDRLLTDANLSRRLAHRALQRAHERYDVSQMVRQYVAIYAGLLHVRPACGAARGQVHAA